MNGVILEELHKSSCDDAIIIKGGMMASWSDLELIVLFLIDRWTATTKTEYYSITDTLDLYYEN